MKTTMKKILSVLAVFFFCLTTFTAGAYDIANKTKIYFDASEYPEIRKQTVVQLVVGKSDWSQCYKMNLVQGYDYLYEVEMPKWNGCTEICFMGANNLWGGEGSTITHRKQYMPAYTPIIEIGSNLSGNVTFTSKLERLDNCIPPISYALMGINKNWTTGIALKPNPEDDEEFMLLNQSISNEKDAVKVVILSSDGNVAKYIDSVKESPCSPKVTRDGSNNIKLPDGTYDFYYSAGEIYITPSPSSIKYVLMGVNGDWDNGIELKASNENDYELVLLGQEISKTTDAVKIVKKTPCGDEFYSDVKIASPVPFSGGGSQSAAPNIVLEDGIYDFYFDKNTKQIYIGGELDKANVVYLDPKVEDGNDWETHEARFAVYYFNDKTSGWVSADKCGGLYFAYIPSDYTRYDWVRIKKDGSNSWDDRWDQTHSINYDKTKPLTKLTKPSSEEKHYDCYQTTYTGVCGNNYKDLDCTFPAVGDTVYVHINQFVENDLCNYVFDSFEQAFAVLKTRSEICDATTKYYGTLKEDEITFKVPVVMLVHYGPAYYRGTEKVGSSGGNVSEAPAIFFRNINKDGGQPLIVRTADPKGNRAVLVHPVIRRSKNIELNNLDIVSDDTLLDNALDIDNGMGRYNREGLEEDFNKIPLPNEAKVDATINVTIKNCFVESFGRNCIHLSGVDGVHIENNEFYTKFDFKQASKEVAEDVVDWGGTIKMINSTNIKFLRNNSEGTLATSFFIQGCQGLLIMNNVFWNANSVVVDEFNQGNRTVANIRLVTVDDAESKFPLKNIGIYYNTFFIQNSDAADDSYVNFDFFRLGGADKESKQLVTKDNMDNFVPTTIRFKYNNCYSYDDDIIGNNRYDTSKQASDPVNAIKYYLQGIGEIIYKQGKTEAEAKIMADWCACFSYNNFWSEYDKILDQDPDIDHGSSNFEIGMFCTGANETFNLYQDVSTQVCKTSPTNPGSLVVLGGKMNIGTVVVDDVSLQGADKLYNDRLNPDNGLYSARPQVVVDNKNESLSPNDHIYEKPGTINLYTSPLVGSQTTDVHISSLDLSKQQKINLTLVDKDTIAIDSELKNLFGLTNENGVEITSLQTDATGSLNNAPVYVTFSRPDGVDENKSYEVFLKVMPSEDADDKLVLMIPIRGHHKANIESIPGAWTVGAFQQRHAMPVDTIVWHGTTSTDWDNRNNWYKTDGTLVTCLDALTEDLTVIIPNKDSEKYITPPEGITQYPKLPAGISTIDGFAGRHVERVNAGSNDKATKVANKIYMEYGAALVGVEELNKGLDRYSEAEVEFTARRKDWLLVGSVVKPWELDEEGNQVFNNGEPKTRDFKSGDYYLNHLPHVYMHEARIDTESGDVVVNWNETFAPLDVVVDPQKVFAVRLPNQYGPKKFPASVYNKRTEGANYDGDKPHTYNYKGRFYNESKLPYYEGLTPGKPVLLTNTYPANIDADELKKKGDSEGNAGTYLIYDYDKESFVPVGEDQTDAVILSQHGFVFTPANEQLQIEKEYFLNNETGHRSLTDDILSLRLRVKNEKASVSSEVYISYDEFKEDKMDYAVDAPKVFNGMVPALPDVYVMRYDKNWAGLSLPDITKPIPLGVRVSAANQVFKFTLVDSNLPFDIILEDRQEEKTYNLSAGETCEVSDLVVGKCEGRFYLNLSERSIEELPEGGEDVTTDVQESDIENSGIDIYTEGNKIVVSSTSDVELQTIMISDISGRHQVYNVSGRYVTIDLPVSTGVYTIYAIGDKASRIEKLKLN